MEGEFASAVAAWDEFYETVAGAAGTLMGLLFVSLAINPAMMGERGPHGTRVWSEQTFHSFLVLLVIAIVALIPDQTGAGLGIPLLILGVQGLVKSVRDVRVSRRDPDWDGGSMLMRLGTPALAYALLTWAAVLSFRSDPDAMGWLVAVTFLLMMSALVSCWELLKGIGDQATGG